MLDPDNSERVDEASPRWPCSGGEVVVVVPRSASGGLGAFSVAPHRAVWSGPETIATTPGIDVSLRATSDGRVLAAWSDALGHISVAVRSASGSFSESASIDATIPGHWPSAATAGRRLAVGWLANGATGGPRFAFRRTGRFGYQVRLATESNSGLTRI